MSSVAHHGTLQASKEGEASALEAPPPLGTIRSHVTCAWLMSGPSKAESATSLNVANTKHLIF